MILFCKLKIFIKFPIYSFPCMYLVRGFKDRIFGIPPKFWSKWLPYNQFNFNHTLGFIEIFWTFNWCVYLMCSFSVRIKWAPCKFHCALSEVFFFLTKLSALSFGANFLYLFFSLPLWFKTIYICRNYKGLFKALGINQVTYSNCKFCRSVCPSWFCYFRHFQVS